MAITLNTDLLVSAGKLTNVELIQGAWRTVDTVATMNALTGSANEEAKLEVGQIFYVEAEDKLYKYRLVGSGFFATKEFQEFEFPSSGGGSTPDGTISGSQQISDLGFLSSDDTSSFTLVSDFNDITSSLSTFVVYSASNATTASYIDPDFISASAAEAGFGSGGGSEVGGIFIETGSFFATTNDLQITGSVTIGDGLLKFKEYDSLPSVEGGTIAYYDGVFWLGQDN